MNRPAPERNHILNALPLAAREHLYPHLKRRRTYPGFFPVLHLDHIYYEGTVEVLKVEMPRTRLSLMASDHLPLVAELSVEF